MLHTVAHSQPDPDHGFCCQMCLQVTSYERLLRDLLTGQQLRFGKVTRGDGA